MSACCFLFGMCRLFRVLILLPVYEYKRFMSSSCDKIALQITHEL